MKTPFPSVPAMVNKKLPMKALETSFICFSPASRSLILSTGSAVAAAFHFIQFCLGLNFLQLIVWAILVVIPFMLQPPTSFSWSIFRSTSPKYLLQGYGMGQTFLLYGPSSLSSTIKIDLGRKAAISDWLQKAQVSVTYYKAAGDYDDMCYPSIGP